MVRISIKSMLLMVVYAAICCLVYLHSSLWIGWLVVIATAFWMALAIVHATHTHNSFTLGFAVTGCVWLIIWLGFAIETPTTINIEGMRKAIYRVASLGRTRPEYDPSIGFTAYAQYHDVYISVPMGNQSPEIFLPYWHNALRLVVCLSALTVATVCGALFHFVCRNRPRKCLLVANSNNSTITDIAR
jgi:hypothetical protein